MATLEKIEKLTREYANARESLANTVRMLETKIETIKRQYLPTIKRQVGIAKEKKANLFSAIEESPELFVKPRTVIFAGVKVGYEKGKGKIEWESDDQVVRLIRKHFPDQEEVLIKKIEKPIKKALANLSVADLKKIGVTVEETGDVIVIRPTDSEVDKLVEALLKDNEEAEAA